MNDNLTKNFCEMYRGRVSATDDFVYSLLAPSHNTIHEGPGSVKTEPIIKIELPETDYQQLCKLACEQEIERELRNRHGQVYVAWHQYQMMLSLYK